MTGLNLDATLQRLPSSRLCLIVGRAQFTISETLEKARTWRASMPETKYAHVALCGLAPLEFLLALIALDGHAAQILLLPPSLDTATIDKLNAQAETTHILAPGENRCYQIRSTKAKQKARLVKNPYKSWTYKHF